MSQYDEDKVSRKSQGSNLKDFSRSITSSIGSIFKKQNMIKIAPVTATLSEIKLQDIPDEQMRKMES